MIATIYYLLPIADCQLPICTSGSRGCRRLRLCGWFWLRLGSLVFGDLFGGCARWVFVPGVAIVNVVNAAHCRRRVRPTESGVLNQRDEGNLRFICWCVTDEPRVVLILA